MRGVQYLQVPNPLTAMIVMFTLLVLAFFAISGAQADVCRYYLMLAGAGSAMMMWSRQVTFQLPGNILSYTLLGTAGIILVQTVVWYGAQLTTLQVITSPLVVIAGAFAEEIFFRGGLLSMQMSTAPSGSQMLIFVILVNALVFTTFHVYAMKALFGTFETRYMLAIFGSGIVLCALAIATGGIEASCFTHALINLIASVKGMII
jgi:membrane protease YdiL (CAAX protease family)